MSNAFACPNPACPHEFPATAAGAAVLTCPRCGTVFQLRAGAPSVASGTASAPRPRPVPPPSVPLSQPVEPAPADELDFGAVAPRRPGPARRPARRRQPGAAWKSLAVVLPLLLALGGGILLAIRHWPHAPEKAAGPAGDPVVFKGLNFRFLVPGRNWHDDEQVKARFPHARLALRRREGDAWFAVLVKDFRTRDPRPRELRAEGLFALEQFFTESLEHELDEKAAFQGRPAQRLRFRGQATGETYVGACHTFGHLGLGYWVVAWARGDAAEQVEAVLEDLRQRFAFADERKHWEPKQPPVHTFTAAKSGCRLRDAEALWAEAVQPAADYDPHADLVLHAREQDQGAKGDRKKDPRIASTLLVLVLPKVEGDLKAAVGAAREYLLARQKAEHAETVIDAVSDKERPPEQAIAVGNARGHVGLLRVRNGEARQLLVVQAVIPRADDVLILQGECYWKQRHVWEEALLQLVHSLQVP